MYKTEEQLLDARPPKGRESWQLEWEDDKLDLPIQRMATKKGVSNDRALTYAALWNQIHGLGYRVGCRDNVKIHQIRAGVANKIKGKPRYDLSYKH